MSDTNLGPRLMALVCARDLGEVVVSLDFKHRTVSLDEVTPVPFGIVTSEGIPVMQSVDMPPEKRLIEGGWSLVERGYIDSYGLVTTAGREAAKEFARDVHAKRRKT